MPSNMCILQSCATCGHFNEYPDETKRIGGNHKGWCDQHLVEQLSWNSCELWIMQNVEGFAQSATTYLDGCEERMNQEETFDYNLEQLGLK